MADEKNKRIAVIMPVELHAQLVERAQRDKRSLNLFLVLQLEKLVAEEHRNG